MIRCPLCGSERLVLLTFPQDAEVGTPDDADRPLAKCVNCEHRLTVQQVSEQIGAPRN
jgi:DNA-directed RNA polymerase subunit RPC12/RpoP